MAMFASLFGGRSDDGVRFWAVQCAAGLGLSLLP
jgi:hypothetical protein